MKNMTITIKPNRGRNEFLRSVHFLHTAYIGKNGKAYNRKEKYKKDLTLYY